MYNPNDPQRMYLDPNFTGHTYPFTYTAITDPSQVPQGPRPEGNVAYQPTPFASNLSSTLSPSNSTTEYSNTQQQLGASIITYKPGDSPAVGASVPASAAVPYINLMQPPPAPPSPAFDAQRMTAAGQAPSFALFPGAQTVFSQPNTPLQATQTPQVYQAPYLIQSRQQPQTFTAAAAPTTDTPPATPQHLLFFPSAAQATSVTSFYSLTPAAAAPTAVVGGGGASHLASSAAGSAMAYQQPTPPAHSGGGTVAYVVDAGQLLSVTMSPSYVRVTSPSWSAATPLYNTASAATLAPRDSFSLAGAGAAAAPSTSQQRPFSAARATAARHATSMRGDARPPPINALIHRPTGGALAAGASTTAAAAGGSPEGIQPAALGVRNFSAPEPVGSCLLPNLPLDPIIPPLALPCPRWGKLPHSSGGEKDRVTR